jgi:serine phosphatase RsbU (regulator of sigma subunit)/pSer/pThr/pTyr-binding forkhead associated (FHA) protein
LVVTDRHDHPALTLSVLQTGAPGVAPGESHSLGPDAEGATIGRSLDAQICLPEPGVSRAHARLARRGRVWHITDLASRAGTLVNGVPLSPGVSSPLRAGDLITIGATTLRVEGEDHSARADDPTTVETIAGDASSVVRARTSSTTLIARLLDLLIAQSRRLQACDDAPSVYRALVEGAQLATGSRRAMALLTDHNAERAEALAAIDPENETRPSRTLLRRAIDERAPVMLTRRDDDLSHSLAENRVAGALCTPIEIGPASSTLLYLESDDADSPLREEAAEVCVALASLAAGALERVRQRDLAQRRERLERDLLAAREVQSLIFPKREGVVGAMRYAFSVNPGAFLAGDLFDAFALADGRAAIFLGDVTGEGVDAAVLMSSAAAALHAALVDTGDPSRAVERVNRYLAERSPMDRFVSLWLGVFDPDGSAVTYIDAGHGHWLVRDADTDLRPGATGIPLGIDGETRYAPERIVFAPDARLILYSDGIIEQRAPGGEQFGAARLGSALSGSSSAADDVRIACEALRQFAGTTTWDDDASIASITRASR